MRYFNYGYVNPSNTNILFYCLIYFSSFVLESITDPPLEQTHFTPICSLCDDVPILSLGGESLLTGHIPAFDSPSQCYYSSAWFTLLCIIIRYIMFSRLIQDSTRSTQNKKVDTEKHNQ